MSVTLKLDDVTAAYLVRLATDQGRTPAEVAAWIVTEDLRREQAIDADLLARLNEDIDNDRTTQTGVCPGRAQI